MENTNTPTSLPTPTTAAPTTLGILKQPQNGTQRIYKVMVVDDEPDAREIFFDILSSIPNIEVSTAVDGKDCLAKAEATKFDVILLDIVMPNVDGIQVLTDLLSDKTRYGNPRITMLTNMGGDLAVEEALRIGAVGYKVKIDTEPDQLVQLVQDEIAKLEE